MFKFSKNSAKFVRNFQTASSNPLQSFDFVQECFKVKKKLSEFNHVLTETIKIVRNDFDIDDFFQ